LSRYDGNVFVIGDFDESMDTEIILPLIKCIQKQRELRDGRIDLHINSGGGSRLQMQQIIELVEVAKRDDIIVRTIVPFAAFSAGSMVAVTGTPGERYISRSGMHLLHYGSTWGEVTTPLQIDRTNQFQNTLFKGVIAHYKKYADVPDLEANLADDGFVVPANKAVKYGLADKYMDVLDIGYDV
jgi:ATP-dependent protease ClpP protease subunit